MALVVSAEIMNAMLISGVERRPGLYRRDYSEFYDKNLRQTLWTDIGRDLFPNWDTYNERKKKIKVQELKNKWRVIRISFSRHLRNKKTIPNYKGYKYADMLMFLVPEEERHAYQQEVKNINKYGNDLIEIANGGFPLIHPKREIIDVDVDQTLTNSARQRHILEIEANKARKMKDKTIKTKNTPAKTNSLDEIRGRRNFLLSLLPDFMKFDDDQRYMAEIEILNVMRHVKSTFNVSPLPHGHWPPFTSGYPRKNPAGSSNPGVSRMLDPHPEPDLCSSMSAMLKEQIDLTSLDRGWTSDEESDN